jgi:hypothetical protein
VKGVVILSAGSAQIYDRVILCPLLNFLSDGVEHGSRRNRKRDQELPHEPDSAAAVISIRVVGAAHVENVDWM